MPHNDSAKKRLRQNETRRLRNKSRATELKTLHKQVERAHHDGKVDEATTLYRDLAKRLDQAAASNTIHKNAANRTKARMAKLISKPAVAPVKGVKPVKPGKPAPAAKSAAAKKPAAAKK